LIGFQSLFDCVIQPVHFLSGDMKLIFCSALQVSTESTPTFGFNTEAFKKNDVIELALESEDMDDIRQLY
jgi:hypothetical protein